MDLASATVHGSGSNLRVSYGDDKGLLVEFTDDAIELHAETEKQGRAIFKQVPFLSIIFPGDKTKRTYRPATEADKARFPQQWAAFEKGSMAGQTGTPITEWNYLSKSQALELKHMGFWTVEMLASASDTQIGGFMGGMALRKQAQAFLETSKDGSKVTALVAENETLKENMKIMSEENALIKARLEALEAEADKPKRGRPAKTEE